MKLCAATHGHIWTYDGERAYPVALRGKPEFVEWMRQIQSVRPEDSPLARVIQGQRIVHVVDARQVACTA